MVGREGNLGSRGKGGWRISSDSEVERGRRTPFSHERNVGNRREEGLPWERGEYLLWEKKPFQEGGRNGGGLVGGYRAM